MPARDVDVLAVTQLRRNRATIQAYCDALRSIEMPSFDVSLQDQCPEVCFGFLPCTLMWPAFPPSRCAKVPG